MGARQVRTGRPSGTGGQTVSIVGTSGAPPGVNSRVDSPRREGSMVSSFPPPSRDELFGIVRPQGGEVNPADRRGPPGRPRRHAAPPTARNDHSHAAEKGPHAGKRRGPPSGRSRGRARGRWGRTK